MESRKGKKRHKRANRKGRQNGVDRGRTTEAGGAIDTNV